MKRFKKQICWLLVAVLAISGLFIGFGLLNNDDAEQITKAEVPASQGVSKAAGTGITFYVPELIYLTPVNGNASTFQYYVDSNTSGTLNTQNNKTSGVVYFRADHASAVSIAASGASVTLGASSSGSGTLSTTVNGGTMSSGIGNGGVGTVTWTATYTVDGVQRTAKAYSVVYAPHVRSVGVILRMDNSDGSASQDKPQMQAVSYITGVHGIVSGGSNRHFKLATGGGGVNGMAPLLGDVRNPSGNNWHAPDYAEAATDGTGWVRVHEWSGGDNDRNEVRISPRGGLTVDTSRYNNINQIPNLRCGIILTNLANTRDGARWYMTNYSGGDPPVSGWISSLTPERGTNSSGDRNSWWHGDQNGGSTGRMFAGADADMNPKTTGIWYGGTTGGEMWSQSISGTGADNIRLKAAGFSRADNERNAGIMFTNIDVTKVSKSDLRADVRVVREQGNYSAGWATYDTRLQEAYQVLGNPTATQAQVDTARTNLTNAVSGLTFHSRTATITHSLPNTTNPVETLGFSAGETITATANTYTGYSLSGTSPVVFRNRQTDLSYTFNYTANNYNVVFNANGGSGSMSNQSIAYNASANLTANAFTRTGYTFAGWNTQAGGGGTSYGNQASYTMNTEGVTLYAQWSGPNSYNVTFNANGGSGSMSAQSITFGQSANLTANAFTRTGYTFAGWNTQAGGGGTSYANQASYTMNTEGATLYAQWTAGTYNVTFNANGGSGSMSPQGIVFGQSANLTANAFTRTGYTFAGWNTQAGGGGTSYANQASYTMNTEGATLYAQWTAGTYNVTFNANGGSGSMNAQSITFGQSANLTANAFTRTGYSFDGWATLPGGPKVYDNQASYTMNTEGATLYARWAANAYNVTFNANGGSGSMSAQSITFGQSANLTANAFTRTGYTFAGWNTQAGGGGTSYANQASYTMNTEGATLYAQWTANTYTVTFNANGGTSPSPADRVVTYNAAYGLLAATSRTGYTFSGWYTASSGGTKIETSTTVTTAADHTLYAQWTANSYNVTFDANGGSGSMSAQSITFGQSANLTANAFTRTGYSFDGWATLPGGPKIYDNQASYTMNTEGATLYARWTANAYNVTFNANGGSGSMSAQSITFGQSANLTANAFTRTGYTFAGWATSAGGSVVYGNEESFTMNTEGATLYAQWTINQYSIVFNSNGGSAVADIYDDYGTQVPAPTNPTRPGHNFVAWYTDEALQNAVTWPYTLTGDVTFYAKWAVSTVTITFNANGGTGGTSGLMQPGDPLTAPTVTRAGYVFGGWDPTVPATVPGTSTTYTAQWVQTAVTLTRTETGFDVRIYGWTATNRYQIWSYQKVTGDVLLNLGTNVPANQWILSNGYTAGSGGAVQQDGSILFSIANFVSPDANYTVAVRIADAGGNFISELRDSYTPDDVQEVVINKVLVDGAFSTGREFKEVKPGAAVVLTVECNNLPDLVYSASVSIGGSTVNLTPVGNQFLWSIADLDPARYTVEIEVTNGVTTAKRSIDFQLYSVANIEYGIISNMILAAPNGALSITPTYANGSFSYRLGEPGRAPSYRSVETTGTGTINHPNTLAPGVYRVVGLATRLGVMGTIDSFDDGIARTITVGRPGTGSKTMTLTANPGVEPEVGKGTAIQFTANATIGGASDIQYSFWRYDAKGYVLIKDWSSSNTLDWTPARIGIYTIEARAKGSDAGSFEVMRNMVVNVTDNTQQIAQVTNITLNTGELNETQARRPATIKANATSVTGENLLYKFHMEDEYMGVYQLQDYSADQHCVWTPRKPGTYTVHVLVKNEYSFGRFDAKETFEITVS